MRTDDFDQYKDNICDALAALTRDTHDSRSVDLLHLYDHVQTWLTLNGRGTVPISTFARMIRHIGYRYTKRPHQRVYGIAFNHHD